MLGSRRNVRAKASLPSCSIYPGGARAAQRFRPGFPARLISAPMINSAADARQFAATQNIRRSVSAMGPRCARWQNPPILAFADEERVVVWRS
jgi:hypothetical protein